MIAAKSAVDDGDFVAALDHLQAALRFNPSPESPQFFFLHGKVCFNLEQNEEAEKHLRSAVELNPKFMPALTLLAAVLLQTGRTEEYEDVLKKQVDIGTLACSWQRSDQSLLLICVNLAE